MPKSMSAKWLCLIVVVAMATQVQGQTPGEHFALELQTISGMDTGYGRTRETAKRAFTMSFTAILKKRLGGLRAEPPLDCGWILRKAKT